MTPGRCSRAVRAALFAAVCVLLASLGHVTMSGVPVPWWAVATALPCLAAAAWFPADRERGLLAVTTATVAVQAALHAAFSLVQSLAHPALPTGTSFARQWARYLTCGDTSAAALSPREALRVVADAGLTGVVDQPPPGTPAAASVADPALHSHYGMHGMHGMHGVHGMADSAAGAVLPSGHAMPGMAGTAGMSPAGMLAAHLLAAVLAGLWLAYGERAAFRLLRLLAAWFRAPLHLLFVPARIPHRPPVRGRRERRHSALRQLLLVHAITSRGPPAGTAVI
ncbi:hypothetical protein AB0953_04900 [Streptomyces sp. NPDC046866]|uniref:hypothetical protein n=1 Tax=Streptomyces sp. NPDC046866 TaxID=3154921 RepID=UPI0034555CCF